MVRSTIQSLSHFAALVAIGSVGHGETLFYLSVDDLGKNSAPVAPQETLYVAPSGVGQFHLWAMTSVHLTGFSLNIDEVGGVIRFTDSIVYNPASGSDLRWLPDLIRHGSVSDRRISRIEAGALVGLSDAGKGLAPTTALQDALFESASGFLLATISFEVVDADLTSDLFLSIGRNLIGDTTGISTDPLHLGVGDGPVANTSDSAGSASDLFLTKLVSSSADFNLDGAVDATDQLIWQRGFGLNAGAARSQGDANKDGKVDASDFAVWSAQFGMQGEMGVVEAIPEPTSGLLLLLGIALGASRASPQSSSLHDESP